MDLQGKIIAVLPERSGVSARGEWKAGSFVLETHDNFPKKMVFDVFGAERLAQFAIKAGEELIVSSMLTSIKDAGTTAFVPGTSSVLIRLLSRVIPEQMSTLHSRRLPQWVVPLPPPLLLLPLLPLPPLVLRLHSLLLRIMVAVPTTCLSKRGYEIKDNGKRVEPLPIFFRFALLLFFSKFVALFASL